VSERTIDFVIITRDLRMAERVVQGIQETCKEYLGAIVLVMRPEVGCTKAQNQGWKATETEYVCIVNDDAFVTGDCLSKLVDALDKDTTAAAAGPTMPCRSVQGRLPRTTEKFVVESPYLIWSCILMRREAFESVHLLDEQYHVFHADVDACYQMRDLGWRFLWVRDAWCNHFVGGTVTMTEPGVMTALVEQDDQAFRDRWGTRLQDEEQKPLRRL
jgi:GT2 family glycosyltransferase